jgi:hypothetical protein
MIDKQFDRTLQGSLFDCGRGDAYFHRAVEPHWYRKESGLTEKVLVIKSEEIDEYLAGYRYQEAANILKDPFMYQR